MKVMKKVRIAQIGLGHDHAPNTLRSLIKQSDIFEFEGLCLPENEMVYADKIEAGEAKIISLEDIFENPEIEAVAVETEEKNLTKYALMAINHGKHIHMDKPGGTEISDFERLINGVKEKNLHLNMGYMYRYNAAVKRVKEEIKNGDIGEVYAVEAHMSPVYPTTAEKRQWLSQFKGGMMFFLGCHLIDIIVSIMGEPERIIPFLKSTGIEGTTSEDYGVAVLEYKNGISFAKCCAAEAGGGDRRQIVVCGTKKTVEIKPIEVYDEGSSMHGVLSYYPDGEGKPENSINSESFDRYDGMMKSFAENIRGLSENQFSPDYELMLYKCIMKACGKEI